MNNRAVPAGAYVVDITVAVGDAVISDLGGTARITLAHVPGDPASKVYHVAGDGDLEEMPTFADENGIWFETTHLSKYAVIGDGMFPAEPKEGIGTAGIAAIAIAIVLFAVLVFAGTRFGKA